MNWIFVSVRSLFWINGSPQRAFLQLFSKGQMLTNLGEAHNEESPTCKRGPQTETTTQFGIQVDMNCNPETLQSADNWDEKNESAEKKQLAQAQRRKLNKKLNKKRRKEKCHQQQRQARRQIGNIIQQLYQGQARFEDYADEIETLVQKVYNNDFRDYLDQLIRMRVNYIQKSIWEYTQTILEDNPFEHNEDHAFYSQIVDQIYQRYLEIEDSSREIQKIINIYLKFAYQKNQSKEEIIYNNLAINTFNYMIETDDTLKNLLHICEKKISPTKQIQHKKLQELISITESYYDDYRDETDEYSTSCADDLSSTGHSEEDQNFMGKRRRRRKVKESQLLTSEESLVRRLQGMTIRDEERAPCRVSEDWLKKIALKGFKYRK